MFVCFRLEYEYLPYHPHPHANIYTYPHHRGGSTAGSIPHAFNLGLGLGIGLKKKRTRTRTSLDLSMLPISRLLPWQLQALPTSPTQLLSITPLPIPSPPPMSLPPARVQRSPSLSSRSTTSLDLGWRMDKQKPSSKIKASSSTTTRATTRSTRQALARNQDIELQKELLADYAPNARNLVVSGGSFTQYSWLLDIIHDHTAGLFKHSRLSQLGPYRLAKVFDSLGLGGVAGRGGEDSGYCSSPARTAETNTTGVA